MKINKKGETRKVNIFMSRKQRDEKRRLEFQGWFDGLDEESQQETTLKYLRRLDTISLRRLYEAVDLYRKADKILKDKVRDPVSDSDQDANAEDKNEDK